MKDAVIPYSIVEAFRQIDNIYECRLFGWILAKAQSVLKLYNRDLGDINIEHAMNLVTFTIPARYLLNYGDNNYRNITKAFSLAGKFLYYEKDNVEMKINIIAFPTFETAGRQKRITCVIHNVLWHALLDFSKGYRLVNLPTYMNLQSKYSIVMFILVSQQTEPVTFSIQTLRRLTGTDGQKSYERSGNFFARVIEPARRELNEKSPYTFDYTAPRTGLGGRYQTITIIPKRNAAYRPAERGDGRERAIDSKRVRLDERVTDYLVNGYGMSVNECEQCENLIAQLGTWEDQIAFLERVRHAALAADVRNVKGYLVQALKNRI